MAKRHIAGYTDEDVNCRCDNGTYYINCGDKCECCDSMIDTGAFSGTNTLGVSGWSNRVINPASKGGFGFNKSYDGRIRGGIITPEFYTSPKPIKTKEFNKFI